MFPYLNIFEVEISVYFLFISLIFTAVVPIITMRAKALSLPAVQALDLYLFVLVGSFVGARGMYVLYQEPSFYLEHPAQILYFWNGGYIFFGGFLGAVVAGLLFCKMNAERPLKWLNFSIPILSLGYAVGRIACFLSGCCYGKELDAWWSVFMHQAYRHPTQLYASFMEFLIFGVLVFIEKKKGFKSFLVFPLWMVLHGIARIIMECFRDDPRGVEILGLSVSTNISIALMAVGFLMLVNKIKI
ncbi:MAG: prolipoprotein diacylglyceryl transferase [Bdellovibrionales bacterium]